MTIGRTLAPAIVFGALALCAAPRALALDGPYEEAVTRIEVRLTQRLSSQDATAGDVFHFDTTSSVMVAGRFFPADTHGHGVVVVARSGCGTHTGSLVLAARSLDPAAGAPVEVGLEVGQLDRTLDREVRGFTVPVGSEPVYVGTSRVTNVVYEAGTRFYVDAPPPAGAASPAPESTEKSGIASRAAKRVHVCPTIDRSASSSPKRGSTVTIVARK